MKISGLTLPFLVVVLAALALASSSVLAQQSARVVSPVKTGVVPSLISYSDTLKDASGRTVSSTTGVTFLLYKDSQGGAPLWMETQNVTPDQMGHYTVQLGSTTSAGLPAEVFMSGEARWLAVQMAGEAERPRVLLVAVPYAMKAADAETIGGLPPSAFMLAPVNSTQASTNSAPIPSPGSASVAPSTKSNVTTTGGTVNAFPLFTTATNIQNSIVTQTGTKTVNVAGKLNLPATGTATAAGGKNSRAETMVASSFSSSTNKAVNQTFEWQAEPVGNNTTSPSGTLNLLFGSGASAPTETGLRIASNGQFTFATGQTFPGTGTISGVTTASGSGLTGGGTSGTLNLTLLSTCSANQILKWSGTAWACAADANSGGTVTSVGLTAPASDFTVSGSPVTSAGTLGLAWTVAPTSNGTPNAIVKRDSSGTFAANGIIAQGVTVADLATTNLLTASGGSSGAINASTSSPGAATIQGYANATTGSSWGVYGVTQSNAANAYGVVGYAPSSTGNPIGVYGVTTNPSAFGVFGQNGSLSATATNLMAVLGNGAGMWGDGGAGNSSFPTLSVVGTIDDGIAGIFENNSPSGYDALDAGAINGASIPFFAQGGGGNCYVDAAGNLNCTGAKHAVIPIDGGKRIVAMAAVESPQNWFEDFGSAQLSVGVAIVALDPDFMQTVNTEHEYHVFLTPNGDCRGLYISNRTPASFEVRELGGGSASVPFSYRVVALRKKYENVRFEDHTHDLDGHKRMMERRKAAKAQAGQKALPELTSNSAFHPPTLADK